MIVERPAQFQPPTDPFLVKYRQMRDTLQTERSVYNDFELEAETKREEIIKQRKLKFPPTHKYDLPDYFSFADEQALVEPVKNDNYIPLKPQDVDNKQSVKQVKPHSSVYLLVKTDDGWEFPGKNIEDEKSLEDASKTAIETHPGNEDLKVVMSSSLPISVHVNKYSRKFQTETNHIGVKTFFMKSKYQNGNFKGKEFMWCTKEQLSEFVPENVLKSVEPCLNWWYILNL